MLSQPGVYFRFFDLPTELQLQVLGRDVRATLPLILVSRQAKTLYTSNSASVLRSLLRQWPLQQRNIVSAILCVRQGLVQVAKPEEFHELYDSLIESASPNETTKRIEFPAEQTINLLYTLTLDIEIFCNLFIDRTLNLATIVFEAPNPSKWPPLPYNLSAAEFSRIQRSTLRIILLAELFHIHKMDSSSSDNLCNMFLGRLTAWEIEELETVADSAEMFVAKMDLRYAGSITNNFWSRTCPDSFLVRIGGEWLASLVDSQGTATEWRTHQSPIFQHTGAIEPLSFAGTYLLNTPTMYGNIPIRRRRQHIRVALRQFGICMWDTERLLLWNALPGIRESTEAWDKCVMKIDDLGKGRQEDMCRFWHKFAIFWASESIERFC